MEGGGAGGGGGVVPSNQSMAALAEGGSSKDTVASPFSLPVSRSVYRLIMGCPVFLLVCGEEHAKDTLRTR